MKIKGFKLRFHKTNLSDQLCIGQLVNLDGQMPTETNKFNLGRVIDVRDDKRLGVIYSVYEYSNNKKFDWAEDNLIAISPLLVSDERITTRSVIYCETGKLDICEFPQGNVSAEYVISDDGVPYHRKTTKKVVARSHEIGFVLNYGPPHDRNQIWKYDASTKQNLWLEELHPDVIPSLLDLGCNVRVLVSDDDKPIFYNGKIIMDSANLYSLMSYCNISA